MLSCQGAVGAHRARRLAGDQAYDVSRDGQRFLMIKSASTGTAGALPTITVVLNWTEELKARVPAK